MRPARMLFFAATMMVMILSAAAEARQEYISAASAKGKLIASGRENVVFERPLARVAYLALAKSPNRYFGNSPEEETKTGEWQTEENTRITVSAKTRSWVSLSPVTFRVAYLTPTKLQTSFPKTKYTDRYSALNSIKAKSGTSTY